MGTDTYYILTDQTTCPLLEQGILCKCAFESEDQPSLHDLMRISFNQFDNMRSESQPQMENLPVTEEPLPEQSRFQRVAKRCRKFFNSFRTKFRRKRFDPTEKQ